MKANLFFKCTHNIYTSFDPESNFSPAEDKVRALIMGHCGSGRTYFINNICNTKHKTGIAKGSLTRDIVYQDVSYFPEGKFRIYDTPGSNSTEKAYEHALILRASLTRLPLNLILIQAKFNDRYENTIAQFKEQVKIFKGYESMVVFLISHIDYLDRFRQKEQVIRQLGQTLKTYNMKAKVILYSNIDSDFGYLSRLLYKIGAQNKFTKVQINDAVFHKHFKLSSPMDSLHSEKIEDYIEQIKDNAMIFINFIQQVRSNNPENVQMLPQLKQYMKYYLKEIQYRQYKQYCEQQDDTKTTDLFLLISQYIMSKLEKFDNIFDQKITKKFYQDQLKQQYEIRDLFRQCPNCGLIWMRVVVECPNAVCGDKPNFSDDIRSRVCIKYKFQIKNERLTYQKIKQKPKQSQIRKIEQKKLTKRSQLLDRDIYQGKVGCGAPLKWNFLPPIPNIDEIVKQLYGFTNYEEIKLQVEYLNKRHKKFFDNLQSRVKYNLDVMDRSA